MITHCKKKAYNSGGQHKSTNISKTSNQSPLILNQWRHKKDHDTSRLWRSFDIRGCGQGGGNLGVRGEGSGSWGCGNRDVMKREHVDIGRDIF